MFDEVDYVALARSRYTDQFKNSVNFDYLMLIWLAGYSEIQNLALSLLDMNDVDKAFGYQLDIIGDIVGQPRQLEGIDVTGFFGFQGDTAAQPFGSTTNANGGLYVGLNQADSQGVIYLPDELYRTFIKVKIVSNNSGGTPEDVIDAAKALFTTEDVELTENINNSGEVSLYLGRPWNDEDQTAFPGLDETAVAERLLPVPAGVNIVFANTGIKETAAAVNAWSAASDRLYYTANFVLPENLE